MSSRRCTILVALLLTVIATLGLGPGQAIAADDDEPGLSVAIGTLEPTLLAPGRDVTLTGTVSNRDDHAWTKVQAYFVIPASPFTTRRQIDQATSDGKAYTGVRIIEAGTFDEVGDLAPGQTVPFRIDVPYDQLGITGAEGVYPAGVQILATDDQGNRSPVAVARATTFLPLVSSPEGTVPASIVWPFLMPDRRGADGDYTDPQSLLEAVAPGGRLRNLLDLAASTPAGGATVVLDPALLVGVDDLANDRHVPDDVEVSSEQEAAASTFLNDLLEFARVRSPWILDYDRTDVLALSEHPDLRSSLRSAVERATQDALSTYQLSGRRVSWPTRDGVSRTLLSEVRGDGDAPVIVTPDSVPDWSRRMGSVVKYASTSGPVPLLVDDVKDGDTPGDESATTLRQRLLSEAALAVLERTIDPSSRADAVVLVDPQWDPGTDWASGQLATAFSAPFVQPTSLDAVLTSSVPSYDGRVPSRAKARPLSRAQLDAAATMVSKGRTLSSIIAQNDGFDAALARDVAELLAVRWRLDRSEGLSLATARARRAGAALDKITIEAPPSVTLSSSKGGFPLTIRNDTGEAVRVGVDLDSSNPALTIPTVKSVAIAAGERRTVTVQIDLGGQRTTFLTPHLVTDGGQRLGASTPFKVQSSSISTVLWVAMGAAGVLVLLALVRRFHRRRRGENRVVAADAGSTAPAGDDDDD
ncbi:DUF6049 family protein [Aeromicrobium endophyticum]|uniref:Glycoprotein n=1 Tax=Aeromicrobium endophyticum TaxID=2292704 RepID=A0A371PB31_9ACTN|nr:DUF6049 family protein [Aeromicrobium endophyticum]REK73144.1 hypothetical protein DX116_06095 [Aeromicrobium endophyticum]